MLDVSKHLIGSDESSDAKDVCLNSHLVQCQGGDDIHQLILCSIFCLN